MSRIVKIILVAAMMSLSGPLLAENHSDPYTPSKAEWLEMTSYKAAHELVDLWALDVSIATNYFHKEGILLITISARNGQAEPDPAQKKKYIEMVEGWVRGEIKNFNWASGVKVQAQFV